MLLQITLVVLYRRSAFQDKFFNARHHLSNCGGYYIRGPHCAHHGFEVSDWIHRPHLAGSR